jgi:hypothetical protein
MRTLAHFTSEVSPRCPSLNGGYFDRRELRPLFAVIYVNSPWQHVPYALEYRLYALLTFIVFNYTQFMYD